MPDTISIAAGRERQMFFFESPKDAIFRHRGREPDGDCCTCELANQLRPPVEPLRTMLQIIEALISHNGGDQWLAATGRSITHQDARESIASRGSTRPRPSRLGIIPNATE